MSNNKTSFELMYDIIFNKIIKCPDEFTCVVQEYRTLRKDLQDNNDEYDFYRFNEDLRKAYSCALQDAFDKGILDEASFKLWKTFDGDDIFLED